MSILEFLSSIVSSLAWPTAIALVVFVLKEEIRALLKSMRITKLKTMNFEAEFVESLTAAEKEIDRPELKRVLQDEPLPESSQRLLDSDPNYAVLDAWKQLEAQIVHKSVSKYDNPRNWAFRRHLYFLLKNNDIPEEMGSAIEELRNARNKIVHSDDMKLTKSSASRYIDVMADLMAFFS